MSALKAPYLATPVEIYQEVTQYFPLAQAEIVFDDGKSFAIKVVPLKEDPSIAFTLRTGVITDEFSKALARFSEQLQIAKQTQRRVTLLNVEDLSTQIPLTDWQKFQRIMYEKDGKSCVNAIITYLQNPVDATTLSNLGLAPNQVGKAFTEYDCAYFKEFVIKLRQLPPEQQKSIVTNFLNKFPGVSQRVLQEM